jgi:predicted acyl esterase
MLKQSENYSFRAVFIMILIVPFFSGVYSQSNSSLKQKYDKREVYIKMRDGVKLFTSVYTPKNNSEDHPVLLNRTPYNIEPQGPENFTDLLLSYQRYIEEEYIMVFQDVRGRYMSEGVFEDIRPVIPAKKSNKDIDETTDTWILLMCSKECQE